MKFRIKIIAKKAKIEFKKGLGIGVLGYVDVEYKNIDIKKDQLGVVADLNRKGDKFRDKLVEIKIVEIKNGSS